MRRFWILLALPLMIAVGCIRIEQELTLNADGSASLHVAYTVPAETAQRVDAMLRLAEELEDASDTTVTAPLQDDYTRLLFHPGETALRKKLATYRDLGITIDDLTVEERNATTVVDMQLSIADIARLPEADFFSQYGFSLVRTPTGAYLLSKRPITTEPVDASWDPSDPEVLKMLAPLLGGFRFGLQVTTPGTVMKTTADRNTRYTAEWTFDFDSSHDALAKLQREHFAVLFDSQSLSLPEVKQARGQAPEAQPDLLPTIVAPAAADPAPPAPGP